MGLVPESNLDVLLEEHRLLRRAMPFSWNAFFAGFGALRPVQMAAIPVILRGRNALITAPTAGGKTEAVLAPIAERLLGHRWSGLSVLVVTPTRALVNDLYERLRAPFGRLHIRLGRKTSDHGLSASISEQVIITTPESVESLLTFRGDQLKSLQAVVLDEIHLLDGSPRGDHMRCLLNRLSAFCHRSAGPSFTGLQVVAMSATVSDPRRLAGAFLGTSAEIVAVPGQRDLEAHVLVAQGSDKQRAEAAIGEAAEFENVHKLLVFVNSRKQVDTGAGYFRFGRYVRTPVYGHHGSLSRSQREEAEARFRSDSEAICVATMTLEIGIDIGDVDLVICMDPPFSLASFLQRIGRGCRRLNGRTRALCVARDTPGELMFHALVRQAACGMPATPIAPLRRSVLFQQILAYLKQVPKNQRILEQFVKALVSRAVPSISEDAIRDALDDMVQMGFLDQTQGVYRPASEGWAFIQSNRVYGNIQANPLEVALVDVESGRLVATVKGLPSASGGIRVGGRPYDLVPGSSPLKQRIRAGGQHNDAPSYHARVLPYAFDIGASLANYFRINRSELVVVPIGDSWIVMTWLGTLFNSVLAAGLRGRGFKASNGSFHLTIKLGHFADLLCLMRETVEDVIAKNPLGTMNAERMIDIGPHFKHLSPRLQQKACEEWLDAGFLRNWCQDLTEIRTVEANTEMGANLIALA